MRMGVCVWLCVCMRVRALMNVLNVADKTAVMRADNDKYH